MQQDAEASRYHKGLRTSALIVLFMLLFDGGFLSPVSKELSDTTVYYLANSVGISAQVKQNEYNELMADITAREQELAEREIAARTFAGGSESDRSTYILSIILFILTVLIVLNYVMDWTRVRRLHHEEQAV